MTSYRLSQLAERSGVPATTLRFYEDAGLLGADRTPSGYRMYDEDGWSAWSSSARPSCWPWPWRRSAGSSTS
ncbi:MerR family transcriptional regulator [Streptomyces goshikiensis]